MQLTTQAHVESKTFHLSYLYGLQYLIFEDNYEYHVCHYFKINLQPLDVLLTLLDLVVYCYLRKVTKTSAQEVETTQKYVIFLIQSAKWVVSVENAQS